MDAKWNFRRLPFTVAAGVVLAAGVALSGGTAAFAISSGPQSSENPNEGARPVAYCQDFIGHLSRAVGVGPGAIQSDIAKAARQTVGDAVAKGDLTNEQASAIEAQLSNGTLCSAHRGAHPRMHAGMRAAYCQDFVGHLATAAGVGSGQMQSALATAARETVDDAVAKGDLTSQQASKIKTRLSRGSVCNAVHVSQPTP